MLLVGTPTTGIKMKSQGMNSAAWFQAVPSGHRRLAEGKERIPGHRIHPVAIFKY